MIAPVIISDSIKQWHGRVIHGDNLTILKEIPDNSVELIYIDPPFNTGKEQFRQRIKTVEVTTGDGDRTGFGGKRYNTTFVNKNGYADSFDDFIGFLEPRLREAHRILTKNGSLFFHIDWRESANCRLLLETIFGGKQHCLNEIIWAYDYGARSQKKWSPKHDNIYWFAKDPANYLFNYDAMERIPYMAPELVGAEKAERGKTPTDVWWHTIVATNGKEKTGYPTQKPLALLRWIVAVHSNVGDTVLDFFAGSGTTGEAAKQLNRNFILIDKNDDAVDTINKRINSDNKKQDNIYTLTEQEKSLQAKIQTLKNSTDYRPDKTIWSGSPNAWMLTLPSARKGKLGRELVVELLYLFLGVKSEKKGKAIAVKNKKIAAKFSMLWDTSVYKFEQIRPTFDYYCFLGISPNKFYFWIIPAEEYGNFDKQHNEQSRWVEYNPSKNNDSAINWSQYGGDIAQLQATDFNYVELAN